MLSEKIRQQILRYCLSNSGTSHRTLIRLVKYSGLCTKAFTEPRHEFPCNEGIAWYGWSFCLSPPETCEICQTNQPTNRKRQFPPGCTSSSISSFMHGDTVSDVLFFNLTCFLDTNSLSLYHDHHLNTKIQHGAHQSSLGFDCKRCGHTHQ